MIKLFTIDDGKMLVSDDINSSQVILMSNPSVNERQQICQHLGIDAVTLDYYNSPEEVSRFHRIHSEQIKNANLLVVYDFIKEHPTIETQLAPVIIIFNAHNLIICTENIANCELLIKELIHNSFSPIDIIDELLNMWLDNLMKGLSLYKGEIDKLDAASDYTIENQQLRALTILMRKLVFFEHTINDQADTLRAFIRSQAANELSWNNIQEIQTKQRRLSKMIHIFRDLLESISGLFMGMMDNHLNHLMKFLDSAGLAIALAALVTGFMGMNVGCLPWKNDVYGFWIISGIIIILVIACAIYLRNKKYTR